MRKMESRSPIPRKTLNVFISAIRQGDVSRVTYLLNKIPSLVNRNRECEGLTPLYQAVWNGQVDIVKVLIKHGANVNFMTDQETLIHITVERSGKETEEMCKLLVEEGVDVNQTDTHNLTALHLAIENQREDIVKVLFKLGADINSQIRGMTLLHFAVDEEAERICELLVERGADVNAKDVRGWTPLHMAARVRHLGTMEILLNSGADVDATDVDGNTALHLASKFRKFLVQSAVTPVVLTLIENGANVNIVNRRGETAFQVAEFQIWTTYQRDLLKMQIATNEGSLEDLGISTDIGKQVQLMRKYEEEVQRMRSLKINKTNVTFHDILTKSVDEIALYARNEDVVQALRLKDYQNEFPEYAGLIEGRFNRGLVRKELLDEGHRFFFRRLSKTQDLPYKCTDKILDYLNNRDLTNLKTAIRFDNNDVTKQKTL